MFGYIHSVSCEGYMASADILKKIFKSYKNRDDEAFFAAALEIIAGEKRKNHNLLARDLQRILENGNNNYNETHLKNFKQLPRDKERSTLLLEIRNPQKLISDIILNDVLKDHLEVIFREYRSSPILKTYGVKHKQKLLFAGPPGCGKTLSAQIIANEIGVPLLYTRFDSVISSYLGETAANLRKVFDYAEKGNWVLFFDEFDAIGKSRSDSEEHGELKRVVNTFLQLLDNFQSDNLVIAATNHELLLDKALWRRFDDILYFDLPDKNQIYELLELKLGGFRHKDISFEKYIDKMVGWSHSDIERVCLDSIKLSIMDNSDEIKNKHFKEALKFQLYREDIIKKSK
jgi:SpoVK/Ycf46/Vps4 family AAA+-type ATPase